MAFTNILPEKGRERAAGRVNQPRTSFCWRRKSPGRADGLSSATWALLAQEHMAALARASAPQKLLIRAFRSLLAPANPTSSSRNWGCAAALLRLMDAGLSGDKRCSGAGYSKQGSLMQGWEIRQGLCMNAGKCQQHDSGN